MALHKLTGEYSTKEVYLDGDFLRPEASIKKRNHSPDGFNWGYGGSGAAQLALAICMEIGKEEEYQDFKWKVIAALPKGDFRATFDDVTFKLNVEPETI